MIVPPSLHHASDYSHASIRSAEAGFFSSLCFGCVVSAGSVLQRVGPCFLTTWWNTRGYFRGQHNSRCKRMLRETINAPQVVAMCYSRSVLHWPHSTQRLVHWEVFSLLYRPVPVYAMKVFALQWKKIEFISQKKWVHSTFWVDSLVATRVHVNLTKYLVCKLKILPRYSSFLLMSFTYFFIETIRE